VGHDRGRGDGAGRVPPGSLQHALGRAASRGSAGERTSPLTGDAAARAAESASPGASILILFSDTGGGHRAAARALDGALRTIDPAVRIEWCDPLIGQGRPLVRRICSLYPKIIQRSGRAWGAIYHTSNTPVSFAAIRALLAVEVAGVLARRFRELDVDVVLSVHPLLNHVAARAIRRTGRRRGLMTVVTDLIDLHRGWACRDADLVVVPTEEARRTVIRCSVAESHVQLLGLPVDLRFRPPAPGERPALRRRWNLDERRPTVLVAGGGEGSGKLLEQVRSLAWEPHDWQVIAVCGRNEKLRRRLARLHFGARTLVLGFVDDMPDLMRTADLVVTKAGPGAIAEAMATGVPLVLTGYLPGQETANVRFVEESGIGVFVPRPERLRETVEELLVRDRDRYLAMTTRTTEVAHPYAALDIARECLALAPRYSAASQARR
jgi:1,2-diacylglycerol 3-beta-galactosyltransferase